MSIVSIKPAWQTDDLEQLADTATRFAERDCLPHDLSLIHI